VGSPKAKAPDVAPAPKPPVVAAADPVQSPAAPAAAPTPKKLSDTARPRPAAAANADEDQDTAKPAKPAAKPPAKPKLADAGPAISHVPQQASDSGAPLAITPQRGHGRALLANAAAGPDASPRAAAAPQPNAAHGESGFSVQLASSPSESDARATLSRLKGQFPGVLSGGSIRRADLGSKGIYYRVRVGPLTRDAADKICAQVKAGGAECILTRG
jgi:hypothetical protein